MLFNDIGWDNLGSIHEYLQMFLHSLIDLKKFSRNEQVFKSIVFLVFFKFPCANRDVKFAHADLCGYQTRQQ